MNSHLWLKGYRQKRHITEIKISERNGFKDVLHNETNVSQAKGTGQVFTETQEPATAQMAQSAT